MTFWTNISLTLVQNLSLGNCPPKSPFGSPGIDFPAEVMAPSNEAERREGGRERGKGRREKREGRRLPTKKAVFTLGQTVGRTDGAKIFSLLQPWPQIIHLKKGEILSHTEVRAWEIPLLWRVSSLSLSPLAFLPSPTSVNVGVNRRRSDRTGKRRKKERREGIRQRKGFVLGRKQGMIPRAGLSHSYLHFINNHTILRICTVVQI